MKKLFLPFTAIIFCCSASAQDSSKLFSHYQLSIPGSNLKTAMVPIPAGNFLMGSSDADKDRKPDESPQRRVSIAAFWMGAYEVTRDEFDVFYNDETTSANSKVDAITRPSPQYVDLSWGMGKEGGYPVNSLSQYAALMYCRWLYHKTGVFYRLPTEAEWEYACRAGTETRYYFGNDDSQLNNYAWYAENSDKKFHKVGLKLPNAFGLYDMLGNVCEWTLDHYNENLLTNLPDNSDNPVEPPNKTKYPKTLRGGGFKDNALQLRCAARLKSDPVWNYRDPQIPKSKWWLTDAAAVGFRIICPLQQPDAAAAEGFFNAYLGK